MKTVKHFFSMLVVAAITVFVLKGLALAGPLSGAIFTTTVDGDVVNGNVQYESKEDVYLDGGPGPNAPASAAGLPEGDYYFQVTDPSGKDLLSSDHISCRGVHVNGDGVIDIVYPGTNYVKVQGKWAAQPCQHNEGIDIDHSELGAITIQLFPYDDTPNPGGVYKVWMTPVGHFAGSTAAPVIGSKGKFNVNGENWQPANVHGFIPSWSKTDNYKVKKRGKPFDPPFLTIFKFHDRNANGVLDTGEEGIPGWSMDVTDTLNITTTVFTQADGFTNSILTAEAGVYTVVEETPAGTLQTRSELDGAQLSVIPTANPTVLVTVSGDSGETHLVVYGNVGLGAVKACKIFDRNGDGVADDGEPGIEGWKIQLKDNDGVLLDEKLTGANGCATFSDLLPGTYTVEEIIPLTGNWVATGPTSESVTIESSLSGGVLHGTLEDSSFTNLCTGTADFGTKGFWHNKNGLETINTYNGDNGVAFFAGLNALVPYVSESNYFDAGDEPFDGYFTGGMTPVSASNGINGELLAGEGTVFAEYSQFLVDSNAGGDPREQLAQQLAAFYANVIIYLGGTSAAIEVSPGNFVSAQSLIEQAESAWATGTDAERVAIKDILDALNNNDAVSFVPESP